jgi:hypothetical protein
LLALDIIDHVVDISLIDFEVGSIILCLIDEFGQEALWQTTMAVFFFMAMTFSAKVSMTASRIDFAVPVNLLYFMPVREDAAVDASIVISEVMMTSPRVFGLMALHDRHRWRQRVYNIVCALCHWDISVSN